MTHPPIPPNSPYFRDLHGPALYFVTPVIYICLQAKESILPDWRPIIAAVAEVAWRVEADVFGKKPLSVNVGFSCCVCGKCGLNHSIDIPCNEAKKILEHQALESVNIFAGQENAWNNARAWRDWGKVKK